MRDCFENLASGAQRKREQSQEDECATQGEQGARVAACRRPYLADDRRADKATKVADRIDPCNAASGGLSAQSGGTERPEGAHHGRRNHSLDDHDAGDPEACSDPMQNKVAGHFEQEIPDEKQPRAPAVDRVVVGGIHSKSLLELQPGKTHVDSIDICDDIAEKQQRDQTPGHP